MLCLVTHCFERSLANRRDAGLFIFGQIARVIRKICVRVMVSRCIPGSDEWYGLLTLSLSDQHVLLADDFLQRLKLSGKLDTAIRKKAAQTLSDKKFDRSSIDALSSDIREDFCVKARNYFLFIVDKVQNMSH